jgi:hypothetical protein
MEDFSFIEIIFLSKLMFVDSPTPLKKKQKMFKKQVVDQSNGDARITTIQKEVAMHEQTWRSLQCMSKHGDHCNP